MPNVLVIHGAGMNMRGKTQLDLFGPLTLDDYNKRIEGYARDLKLGLRIFHSNIEGEVVNALYAAHDGGVDVAVINPSAYMNGAPALLNAVRQVRFPIIEVHTSNPEARGIHSVFAPVARGLIYGFGLFGYYLALQAARDLAEQAKPK